MRKMHTLGLVLGLAALLLSAAPAPASDGQPPGRVVFGEDFTLAEGEVLGGDLVLFGGDATLQQDSQIRGNVVVWGGDVEVAGTVEGNLVVFGGDVHLRETAVLQGDLAAVGGRIERQEGARVYGQEVVTPFGQFWAWPVRMPFPQTTPVTVAHPGGLLLRLLVRGLQLALTVVLMAGLAALVAVLWPQPTARVGQAGLRVPLPALGVGVLTVMVALVVVMGLVVTLCLSPVGLAVALAAGVAAVFGWLSVGTLIGERVLATLTSGTVSPFWSAALGAGLLTFLASLLDLIPCVGWLGGFLIACVGLGAVVLTRFGTVDYPSLPSSSEA